MLPDPLRWARPHLPFGPLALCLLFAACGGGTDGNDTDGNDTDAPTDSCGDGVVGPLEVCDDGNTLSGDGCASDCMSNETCGNGVVDVAAGEACDDGNTTDGDGCQANCALATCGNGNLDEDEICDDGNGDNGDGCNATCTSDETCGNGVVDVGAAIPEQCDDGGTTSGDDCSAACQLEFCGNGVVDPGEVCDDSNTQSGDGCASDCMSNEACGNGVIEAAIGEQCDDGGTTPGDGCSPTCSLEYCANGVVDFGEQCDDGNLIGGDGCSNDCSSDETCGNGVLDPSETCEDGNEVGGDGCSSDCLSLETCGNGYLDTAAGEQCDDGGTASADGCSPLCQFEVCANGVVDPGEVCDDGGSQDGDGCSGDCLSDETCGNGVLDTAAGEQCDDGGTAGADGCSPLCQFEVCANGVVDPGEQCDDGGTQDGDGCSSDCLSNETCGNGVVDTVNGEDCDDGLLDGTNFCREGCLPGVNPAVATGLWISCALRVDGVVKCWGQAPGYGDINARGDQPGEMGDALAAVELGTGRHAIQISASYEHICAVLDDRSLKCWGRNGSGQLGLGDTADRGFAPDQMGDALPAVDVGTGRSVMQVAAGTDHTCALLDDTTVKCWGANVVGQLGLGDTAQRGDNPGEMGDALPAVDLGPGVVPVQVAAGRGGSCVVTSTGALKCWGDNGYGNLGLGDINHRGDQPGEMGAALPFVELGTGRSAVHATCGEGGTCVALDDGAVRCWGVDASFTIRDIGFGDGQFPHGDEPGETGDGLPPLAMGTGRFAVSVAFNRTRCALFDDGSIKCWGTNNFGALGLGTGNVFIGDSTGEMGDALPEVDLGTGRTVLSLGVGRGHTCALLDGFDIKCWGRNDYGELGLGDVLEHRGDAPGEMGDALPIVDLGP